MSKCKMVTLRGITRPSAFNFNYEAGQGGAGGYGIRAFFRDPNDVTLEVLNQHSMWHGPDKKHWDDDSLEGWEFTRQQYDNLCSFVKTMTGVELDRLID